MTECVVCGFHMTFSHRSHYHLILDFPEGEQEFKDFCSFRCLKAWVN